MEKKKKKQLLGAISFFFIKKEVWGVKKNKTKTTKQNKKLN